MHAYGTQPSLVKRLCDIYMMVWPGWGATNTSGRESTRGPCALKQKYHLPSKCAVFCAIFFKKNCLFTEQKIIFFCKKFFLLSFTSNLLSFTTFYSVLPRLVLSFTKYPGFFPWWVCRGRGGWLAAAWVGVCVCVWERLWFGLVRRSPIFQGSGTVVREGLLLPAGTVPHCLCHVQPFFLVRVVGWQH